MKPTIAVINTLANTYAKHRNYTGFFFRIKTFEWSNIFISPAVLLIATILKQSGYTVRIYNDLQGEIDPFKINEDIILISCITSSANRAYEIADMFHGRRIIMGGVHVSALPEEAAAHADQVVVGECENVLLDVIQGKIKDKIVYGGSVSNLDGLPFPDFSILKNIPEIVPVQTSRGCNYQCYYCTVPQMYGVYRYRSADVIISELLNFVKNHGNINKIDFRIDADFTFNRERTMEILKRITAEGIKPKVIAANSRLQIYKDHELLSLLSDKNMTLCIGIESLNQKALDSYKKDQKENEISEAINVFHDHNIKVLGYFLFGADQDDENTLKFYTEFIRKSKLDFYHISALTPYPGTGLHKKLLSEKRIFTDNWCYYDGLHFTFRPAKMSAYDMQKEFFDFYKREYSWRALLDPRWLVNIEILRSKVSIYLLLKMFNNDMQNYLSFIENNSDKTIKINS